MTRSFSSVPEVFRRGDAYEMHDAERRKGNIMEGGIEYGRNVVTG